MQDKQYLFICGCPRSGTTALWRLLVAHPQVVLGVERYGNRFFADDFISPAHFTRERFFDLQAGDTFYPDLTGFNTYYDQANSAYDAARYVGDKLPKLYTRFEQLERAFPDARVLFIFRNIYDVAASYKRRSMDETDATWRRDQGVAAAIADWAEAIDAYRAHSEHLRILPVDYEALFYDGVGLESILGFLELEPVPNLHQVFKNMQRRSAQLEAQRERSIDGAEAKLIAERAVFGTYRQVMREARQRRRT